VSPGALPHGAAAGETIGSLSAKAAAGCDRETILEEDRREIKVTFEYFVIVTFDYSNLVLILALDSAGARDRLWLGQNSSEREFLTFIGLR
jgi:hypothetical protein